MSVVEEHMTEKLAVFKHIKIIFNGVKVVLIIFLHPVFITDNLTTLF